MKDATSRCVPLKTLGRHVCMCVIYLLVDPGNSALLNLDCYEQYCHSASLSIS